MAKKPRYHLIMENTWGKLDERFADTLEEAKQKLLAMIKDTDLVDGDRWRIVDHDND